jgi:hypothetical protein
LLLTRLLDSTDAWGGSGAEISRYAPSGFRIFAAPLTAAPDATTPPDTAVWPLSTTLAQFGSAAQPDRGIAGLRQGAVVGADAATLGPVFAKATQDTAFTSGGTSWTLYVRPLLPDELPA